MVGLWVGDCFTAAAAAAALIMYDYLLMLQSTNDLSPVVRTHFDFGPTSVTSQGPIITITRPGLASVRSFAPRNRKIWLRGMSMPDWGTNGLFCHYFL